MSSPNIARASAWMALGTIFSRITGLFRSLLLVGVIGASANADIFTAANSIPNSLYILVAGGIFNVVLVPQLVRAMKNDEDGGDAYANRIVTLGMLILGTATTILLFAIPTIMRVLFQPELFTPAMSAQRESAMLLMALCMPQVFFYGAFVLVGQILNARQKFGPMMWAPIVNNLIALAMLGSYAWLFGTRNGADGFTTSEALLLGLGSTAGIIAQALVLMPYLRSVGFRYRPRFDFRHTGLGHTIKLAGWTLGFIIVNQVSYFIFLRISTGSGIAGAASGERAAGATVYDLGFLVSQVPHGIITVSVTTAIIPLLSALAADGNVGKMNTELGRTLRLTMVLIVPLAVAVACLGEPLAATLTSYGAASAQSDAIGATFVAFSLTMVVFSCHYIVLRAFYAMENTRTPFLIQSVISIVMVCLAILWTNDIDLIDISPTLAWAYGSAYAVGLAMSLVSVAERIGTLLTAEMIRYLIRLVLACATAAAVMLTVKAVLGNYGIRADSTSHGIIVLAVAGGSGALTYLIATRLMKIEELGYLLSTLLRRRAVSES